MANPTATCETSLGTFKVELFDDKMPITAGNFVKLAKHGFYDGLHFHRVIKGFMIQGGDPKGDGSGEPGYVIPDEVWPGAKHDKPGQLCMANRGPNTNGAQFFVTDDAAPHLDKGYTIFGQCDGAEVVKKIARLQVDSPQHNKPVAPVTMTVKIFRK